jgi:flavodoxin
MHMNTLIVYDSQFGNTEILARAIAMRLGEHSTVRLARAGEADAQVTAGIDLLVLGDPTQAHGDSPAFHTWLDTIPDTMLRNQPVAVFDTRLHLPGWLAGSAARTIAHRLEHAGAILVVPPESFFVTAQPAQLLPDELKRADTWAQHVYAAYEARHPALVG